MTKPTQHCFDECTFVIFGATGDLSKRKIIPAIYKLIEDHKLCKYTLLGISFDHTTKETIIEQAKPFIPSANETILATLSSAFHYYQMDFRHAPSYQQLKELLDSLEKKANLSGNRIFYFATMPEHFIIITKNLVKHHIVKPKDQLKKTGPWTRIVYEKPFGNNLRSSKKINRYLAQVFDEKQIYRIDHYLGKELVGNIALARFTNRVLEPLWNNKNIESININLCEKIGIQGRGAYYDHYGAIKDMVQSHMLQLLALTTMEMPKKLDAQDIRDAKAKVLKKVKIENVVRGQYEGYLQEKGVAPNSTTETYVALRLSINNKRWKGVPFYLRTGKHLDRKESSIQITFKPVKCLLTSCPSEPNSLTIMIQPNEGFYLKMNAKIPGTPDQVTPITMAFSHSVLFGPNTPEAYEILLSDIMKGDQSTFVRADEVDLSWKVIEQIDKLKDKKLHPYPQGCACHEVFKNLKK